MFSLKTTKELREIYLRVLAGTYRNLTKTQLVSNLTIVYRDLIVVPSLQPELVQSLIEQAACGVPPKRSRTKAKFIAASKVAPKSSRAKRIAASKGVASAKKGGRAPRVVDESGLIAGLQANPQDDAPGVVGGSVFLADSQDVADSQDDIWQGETGEGVHQFPNAFFNQLFKSIGQATHAKEFYWTKAGRDALKTAFQLHMNRLLGDAQTTARKVRKQSVVQANDVMNAQSRGVQGRLVDFFEKLAHEEAEPLPESFLMISHYRLKKCSSDAGMKVLSKELDPQLKRAMFKFFRGPGECTHGNLKRMSLA